MDFDDARAKMVRLDLAGRDIDDPRVLDAFASVARERFVPVELRDLAYADRPLPIGDDQTISQPYIVALTVQALAVQPTDRVLDVGTGSGYAAAVLAQLAAEVHSVERIESLARAARDRLESIGERRVHVVHADGSVGLPEHAPYDAIAVAAAADRIPEALVDQLADGGRLVIPVGPSQGAQRLVRVVRHGDRTAEEFLCDVRFVPLVAGADG